MQENIQKMERLGVQLRRARLPGVRDVEVPDRHPEAERLHRSQHGVAGIPTAWTARWGSGKPVIALGSDVDCIPQASQKPGVAYHDPIIEGAPGHGEGHNSGMPLQIAAALAVKKVMEQQHLQGTLMLWPGIAEELVGTKAYYVRAGLFKDVDISIFAHVGDNLGVSWGDGTQNGLVSVEYSFKGESAHAAGAPWRGRSALDAVELMDIGWNFRREHLRHPAALALRHHQRRRPAERRPAERVGLVLLPRDRLRAHQEDVGHRRQDGEGRGDDDRHRGVDAACSARRGRGTSTRRSPRRCTRTSRRSGCRSGPTPTRRSRRRCSTS